MHDLLLAKEILDELGKIAKEKKISNIKSVGIEIGTVALAHDEFEEHAEDITLENLEFNLKNIAQNTPFKEVVFKLKKISGNNWKITDIEV